MSDMANDVLSVFPPKLRAQIEDSDGCWLWGAALMRGGYGRIRVGNTHDGAHRVVYRASVGPIPDGCVVDHKCGNRACVNPDHLQAVTMRENGENRVGLGVNNTTGARGVTWNKRARKYQVQVGTAGTTHYGGVFDSLRDAEQAAIALRLRLHTNNLRDRGMQS